MCCCRCFWIHTGRDWGWCQRRGSCILRTRCSQRLFWRIYWGLFQSSERRREKRAKQYGKCVGHIQMDGFSFLRVDWKSDTSGEISCSKFILVIDLWNLPSLWNIYCMYSTTLQTTKELNVTRKPCNAVNWCFKQDNFLSKPNSYFSINNKVNNERFKLKEKNVCNSHLTLFAQTDAENKPNLCLFIIMLKNIHLYFGVKCKTKFNAFHFGI